MFVDEVKVYLKAGDGGNGCMSFRRARFEPEGGPNGGDGGRGGDVILVCDENVGDLIDYRYVPHAKAGNGQGGMGSDKDGAKGKSKYLKLPPGTLIFDQETDECVAELLEHGQEVLFLKGGTGGKGNLSFKSSTNQAPRTVTPGTEGEEGNYRFLLKTIAEAGMVGFPNAGKSSLVGLISKARAKAGAYPFTTLNPRVGVVYYPEEYERLTLADIPGLIKGAHENKGLGHRFLRHIERCRVLILILDMAGTDQRDPLDDYHALLHELKMYDPKLLEKPRIVAGNKIDEEDPALENIKRFRAQIKVPLVPISCLSEEGLEELKNTMLATVKEMRAREEAEKAEVAKGTAEQNAADA